MAKYAFLNFPTFGQVNPTLAIVQELAARGEDVVYFNFEKFRAPIEAAGAKLHRYDSALFRRQKPSENRAVDDNRRLAMLPVYMLLTSRQMVPMLLQSVQAERPDCLVYSDMFLWARIIAHALDIPGVGLRPTYAPDERYGKFIRDGAGMASTADLQSLPRLNDELAHLRSEYALPFSDIASLVRGSEDLTIVFLPRAFQPRADSLDDRYLFVGPSFHPERDKGLSFPYEKLGDPTCLYISLGTLFNDQPEFYNTCFTAFANSDRQVILSLGNQVDPRQFQAIPENFIVAPYVPQLEILPRTNVFITHGGMNSTMESLYFGVPLIVIPHISEQKLTAQRIQELGLGIDLDESSVAVNILQEAVSRVTLEPVFRKRAQAMQQDIRTAGGYRKAVDALQTYVQSKSYQ